MKSFTFTSIENQKDYEVFQKTRKDEKPKQCDGCEKEIKKGDYYCDSDAGDSYCIQCCIEG